VFDDPQEQARYDEEFQKCTERLESPMLVNWTEVWALQDEARSLALKSTELPEFEPMRRMYVDCLRARGLTTFSVPEEALEVAKNLPSDDRAFASERDMAVADAVCRAPIYADFLNLASEEWRNWLSLRQPDIGRVAANWESLIDKSGIRKLAHVEG
jgi:hypothetical protein